VAPDDPDTDPLADTHASDDSAESPERDSASSASEKRRAVHVGDVVGRYELVEDIGEGGMATVYRAKDRELRREVALKVLFPHLARREEVVHRFHREARAAAGLEHANILRVYDVGGAEGNDPPYIVMELIRGRSLMGELEQRGPILAEVVACIGALLADALAIAHKAGIIHRDVKPANVMVASDGRLLLADFGVARLETEDSLVTKTGALLGTPAYMSPEQAGGDTATAKSDLYSLGATMYQLATGVLPYSGSPAKVMAQIAQGQLVPAVKRRTAVGPELSQLIGRLMASEPDARPASARDVAAELRVIAANGGFGDPADELAAYFKDANKLLQEKLPALVSSLVAAAEKAIAESKLPRAIAIADRASALAPEDPAVVALVKRVTEGDRSQKRNRVLAFVGGAAVLAGGGVVGAMKLMGGSPAVVVARDATADAPADVLVVDAQVVDATSVDAAIADASVMDARIDAPPRTRPDAAPRDAAIDAAPFGDPPIEFVPPKVPPDAGPQFGSILVKNDTWCQVKIDGADQGRISKKPIRVEVGHHVVTCEQPGMHVWTKEIDVAANAVATVEGFMLETVAVKLDTDATIDGVPYKAGSVARLKVRRYRVVAGGTTQFIDIKVACSLRTSPELGCY
jgi:serine/threonine-protein kinase